MSRHIQAIAGIGMALGGTIVPSVASAQYNRVPDPNAKRVMVAVFRSGDKGYFNQVVATRRDVTVSYDDIFYLRPGRITVIPATLAWLCVHRAIPCSS